MEVGYAVFPGGLLCKAVHLDIDTRRKGPIQGGPAWNLRGWGVRRQKSGGPHPSVYLPGCRPHRGIITPFRVNPSPPSEKRKLKAKDVPLGSISAPRPTFTCRQHPHPQPRSAGASLPAALAAPTQPVQEALSGHSHPSRLPHSLWRRLPAPKGHPMGLAWKGF